MVLDPVPERAAPAILLIAALFSALPAFALLIRADRDDAEYVELATRYRAAIEIGPGLEGVLIAPRWVLTSAQCVMLLQAAKARPPLEIGGKRNEIQQTFIHPGWTLGKKGDLALVLLREPVPGIEPAAVSDDRDEIDEVVFIVGHGETGKVGEKDRRVDGRKRAAINTVDRVLDDTLGLRIKSGDAASDLQGALSPKEPGAPALLESKGRTQVIGIFSANDGDWQVFARVSSYAKWIDDTMYRAAVNEASNPEKR